MYSPRSVSTTVSPAASIAWSSADSSDTIDLDLMIDLTPWRNAISSTSLLMSAGVSAHSTVAPRAAALRSNISSQTSRLSSARWRMSRPASRVASTSSSSVSASRRFCTNLPWILARLRCSCASLRRSCARALKCIDATCMAIPSGLPGQHFGDVQHARRAVAAATQPALDVEHAADVPQHHRVGAAADDVTALVVGEARRDFAELDRERAAEAAAGLALRHLLEREPGDAGEQHARLRLHAHFAESRAAIVVGDGAVVAARDSRDLHHVDEERRELVRLRRQRR